MIIQTPSFLILFSLLFLLSTASDQERAPHGVATESPIAFSPSAYDFFHPKTESSTHSSCASPSSGCSPLPLAADTRQSLESKASAGRMQPSGGGNGRIGGAAVAGLMVGLAFVVLLAMGGFYVLVTRKANVKRSKPLQPNV